MLLGSFAFEPEKASADLTARRRALVRALLAAEIESQSEYRLHRAQNTALAECYETLGVQFGEVRCYAHAALAYQRAAAVQSVLQDRAARDRCVLAEWRMKCRYRQPGIVRAGMRMTDLLCGYGYQPGRLLIAMFVQLALFSTLLVGFSSDDLALAVHTCLINYLIPLSLSGISSLRQPACGDLRGGELRGHVLRDDLQRAAGAQMVSGMTRMEEISGGQPSIPHF